MKPTRVPSALIAGRKLPIQTPADEATVARVIDEVRKAPTPSREEISKMIKGSMTDYSRTMRKLAMGVRKKT